MALPESHLPDPLHFRLAGRVLRFFSIVWLGGSVLLATAAPPPNDNCAGAIVINGAGPFPQLTAVVDVSEATKAGEPPTPSCPFFSATASRSVWYKFTPAATDLYRISTCGDSGTGTTVSDTILAIYSSPAGCAGPLTQIADGCNDDSCNYQSEIQTSLTGGQTYFFVVWQFDDVPPASGQGFVQLLIDRAAPRNDVCVNAAEVQLNIPVFGTTVFAADDYRLGPTTNYSGVGQTPASTFGRDVVYVFTAPNSGAYNIRVRNYNYNPAGSAPGYDLVVYATTECPSGTSPVTVTNCIAAANRNEAGFSEEITCLPMTAFQKAYIFVDDRISTNRGTAFSLEVTRCWMEAEPNSPRTNANVFVSDISGDINPATEVDYFALGEFPAGYRVFSLLDAAAANQALFQLRVTTETNTLEFDNRDNDSPFGALAPNIAGTPLLGGPAYLRLTLEDTALTAMGPYRLFAVVQPPLSSATVETEPNGGTARANFSAKNYFYGTLPGPGRSLDVDVYGFTAEAGDLLFLSLDGDPMRNNTPLDASLELLSQSGSVLMLVDDPNGTSNTNTLASGVTATSPSSPAEALVYRAAYSGTYYARITVPSGAALLSASGDYLLSVSKNCFAGEGTNTPARVTSLVSNSPRGEGGTATLSGRIVDPDAGPKFRVVVDWGDGSPRDTNWLAVGEYDFDASHLYADDLPSGTATDTYPITLLVFDNYGLGGLTPSSFVVSNLVPVLSNVQVTSPINGGQTATLTGNIADPGVLDTFTLMINWGDGTAIQSVPLPVGSASFSVNHLFNAPTTTTYTISVVLQDDDLGSASGSTTINVRAAQRSTFKPVQYSGGSVVLQSQGTPGATYRILASENLKDWTQIGSGTANAEGIFQFQDDPPLPAQRFYRAVWP